MKVQAVSTFFFAFGTVVGVGIGGYLFSETIPRSFLSIPSCNEHCMSSSELLGLFGSVGMQKSPSLIPLVIKETDKTVVMKAPTPKAPVDYVFIPKKDITDIAHVEEGDEEYIADTVALIGEMVREQGLHTYRVYTNGPGYQTVNYLHFHLLGSADEE